jgi:transcriptional regulator with XRE-family HTH domain
MNKHVENKNRIPVQNNNKTQHICVTFCNIRFEIMIANNIRCLRALRGLSQEALADELGISRARLVTYESGRNEPPIHLLLRLSEYFHISVDALLKGDLTKSHPEALMKVGQNRLLFPVVVDQQGNDLVELIPEKATAGYLQGYSDPEYIEGLQRLKLPFLPSGKHRAFPIKGDSMPPLRSGSYVVGRYVEYREDIREGHTYVVLTRNEGIVYKRVYLDACNPDILILHSDNKQYAPYPVAGSDVLELWEFTCAIDTQSYQTEELNLESIMAMMREMKIELARISQRE